MKNSARGVVCLLVFACLGAAQEPPAPGGTPGNSSTGIQAAPPPMPKIPDVRQPGETGWFIGIDSWFPTQHPTMNKGAASYFTTSSLVTLQGTPKDALGAEAGMAVGLHNSVTFSYFTTRASGNFTTPVDLQLWSQPYSAGTFLTTDYALQNYKFSFNYLTWPYPVESRRFRLRTLWQVQVTNIRTGFDAPLLPLTDSAGNPLLDASGNPISYATTGSHWFILPTLGVQAEYWKTRNLRFEASASGFAIPGHADTWDADATVNYRRGHIELRGGAKSFHFRTSEQADFYMGGTFGAAFVGVRWYSE